MTTVKLHYAVYSAEEWMYLSLYLEHLRLHYRTQLGKYPGYIEVIIACDDTTFKALEDTLTYECIEFV